MAHKIVVTGMGIVSCAGNSVYEVSENLNTQQTYLGKSRFIDSIYTNELPVAEVRLSNNDMLNILNLNKKTYHTRGGLMGILACKEALSEIQNENNIRTGLISSTSVGGMDKTETFFIDYLKDSNKGRLRQVIGHDCSSNTNMIADYFKINDYITTISTACSSAANAIMLGARLIKNNILDRVVVGGVDALTKFTINGFNSLMILDRHACRPFDDTRSGLNIGEGAAFLVLESETIAKKFNHTIYCALSGYGNACDAFHQTASSPEGTGPQLAMQKALDVALIQARDISYINAHGTGTPNNDLSEGKAIESVFNGNIPPFSSTKPFTGHTLGAAGAIEAVISILAIKQGTIFPNLNFGTPIKDLSIKPETTLIHKEIKHVLSNSFGFGGNNTTLIFSKY